RRRDAPSEVPGDDRLAELRADDRRGLDTRVDAGDEVELPVGDERDLRDLGLGVGGRERGVAVEVGAEAGIGHSPETFVRQKEVTFVLPPTLAGGPEVSRTFVLSAIRPSRRTRSPPGPAA